MPPGRVLLAVAALFLLAGCRVDVSVEVETAAEGGGRVKATVTLDDEAAGQVPDLGEQLRVGDLRAAGWAVEGPAAAPGGGVTVLATKRFASSAGATRALQELGGGFGGLRLRVDRGLWKTTSELAGAVDLSSGLAAFGDDELAGLLGNPTLGLDPAALERELGRPLGDVVAVELVGDLAGAVDADAPQTRGGAPVWTVPLGSSVAVGATAEQWNVVRLCVAAVAILSGISLLVVLIRRSQRVSWD